MRPPVVVDNARDKVRTPSPPFRGERAEGQCRSKYLPPSTCPACEGLLIPLSQFPCPNHGGCTGNPRALCCFVVCQPARQGNGDKGISGVIDRCHRAPRCSRLRFIPQDNLVGFSQLC